MPPKPPPRKRQRAHNPFVDLEAGVIDDDDYESVGEDDYEDEDADVSAYEEDDADNEEAEDAVPDVPDLPQAAPPPRAPTRRCVQEPKPKRPWKPPSARRGKKRLEPDVSNDSSSSSDDAPPSPPSSSEEDAAHPDAEESPAEMGVDAEEAEKETRANKRRTAQRKRRAAASPAETASARAADSDARRCSRREPATRDHENAKQRDRRRRAAQRAADEEDELDDRDLNRQERLKAVRLRFHSNDHRSRNKAVPIMFMSPREALQYLAKHEGFLPRRPYDLEAADHPHRCPHCHAPKFKEEMSKPKLCCSGGKGIVQPYTPLPKADEAFLRHPKVVADKRRFNSALAVAAMGVYARDGGRGIKCQVPGVGVSQLRMEGLVYFRIGKQLNLGQQDSFEGLDSLQFFISENARDRKTAELELTKSQLLRFERVQQIIRDHNPAVRGLVELNNLKVDGPVTTAHVVFAVQPSSSKQRGGKALPGRAFGGPNNEVITAVITKEESEYDHSGIVIFKQSEPI